jgi:hypothetical protein
MYLCREYLAANFLPGEVLCLETEYVHLCVGVAHVADDAAVLHFVHVVSRHHVLVARGRDHNINLQEIINIAKCSALFLY